MSPDAKGKGGTSSRPARGRKQPAGRRQGALWGLLAVAAAAAVVIAVLATRSGPDGSVADRPVAPDFTLEEAGGRQVSLAEFRGKPLAIVFYRTFG